MKKFKIIVVIIVIIIVVVFSCLFIDKARIDKGMEPIFAIHVSTLRDGGTKIYLGPGYKIIKYNQLERPDGTDRHDWVMGSWFMEE